MRKILVVLYILSLSVIFAESQIATFQLTAEEKEWLKEHPTIRVANELDWAPYDFNESGTPKGFSIEHFNIIANKIGIKVEYVSGVAWPKLVELFKERKIDVMPVLYRNREREKYTLYTNAYLQIKPGVFTHKSNRHYDGNLSGKKVGIEAGNGSIAIFRKKKPGVLLEEVDFKEKLVQKLAVGELDAVIGNPFVLFYYARGSQIDNIQLSEFIELTELEQQDNSLHIGVRSDWPILHQIIERAMLDISSDERKSIEKKWLDIKLAERVDWSMVAQVSAILLFVFLLLLWNNWSLNSRVKAKTAELNELNKELETLVQRRTEELVTLNDNLTYMANTDSLTGLYNRRYFFDVSRQFLAQARRQQHSLSVAVLDIDFFKKINDSYGHDTGDRVLKMFVNHVSDLIRESDVLARLGGDEFIMIFPETSLEGAVVVAEKIREMVSCLSLDREIFFTVSIGVAELTDFNSDLDSLIKHADIAMYKAKNGGRNRVEVYERSDLIK